MAKKVTLYCTQHPVKGRSFDEDQAKQLLSFNSGWYSEPLETKKSNANISRGNKKKDKGPEE